MTISQRVLKDSLPIIATTIANKFGVDIQLKGRNASTDGKRIILPALSKTALDGNVIYGYLLHECSHIRYTQLGVKTQRHPDQQHFHHLLLNILEDGRIENAISKEYDGAFSWIYEMDEYILQNNDDVMGSATDMDAEKKPFDSFVEWVYFFTRVHASGLDALYSNQLAKTEQDVLDLFGQAFANDVQSLLDESLKARSTEDLCDVADRLIDILKQNQLAEPKSGDPQSSNSSADQKGQSSTESKAGQNQQSNNEASGASSSSQDKDQQSEGNNKVNQKVGQGEGNEATSEGLDPSSEGQGNSSSSNKVDGDNQANSKSATEAASSVLNASEDAINEAMRQADPCKQIADSLTEEGNDPSNPNKLQTVVEPTNFLNGLNKKPYSLDLATPSSIADAILQEGGDIGRRVGRKLAAKIESMARVHRYHTERGNRLSATRLASFVTGNTKVFTRQMDAKKINTAVHIMIDMSFSMNGTSDVGAKKAAIAFAQACGSLKGVDVGVSTFNSVSNLKRPDARRVQTLVKHGQGVCHLKDGLKNIARFSSDGGTPSQDAVMAAEFQLSRIKNANRHILMFITDGDVEDASPLIKHMKQLGIESRGLFIDSSYLPGLFDREVKASSSMPSDEMAKCILDLMTDAVLN